MYRVSYVSVRLHKTIRLFALLTAGKGSRTGMYTEIFVSWILQLFAFWFFNFIFFLENFFLPTTFTHTHTHDLYPLPTTHDILLPFKEMYKESVLHVQGCFFAN